MRFSLRNLIVILLLFIAFLTFTGAFFIVNETTFSDRFGRIINASVRGVIAQYSLTSLLSEERNKIMNEIEKAVKVNEGSFGVKIVLYEI